jgi:hypothetical protein
MVSAMAYAVGNVASSVALVLVNKQVRTRGSQPSHQRHVRFAGIE